MFRENRGDVMDRKLATYYLIIFLVFSTAILCVAFLLSNAQKKASLLVNDQFREQQAIFLQQAVNGIESNMNFLSRELGFLAKAACIQNIDRKKAKETMEFAYDHMKGLYISDLVLIDNRGKAVVHLPPRIKEHELSTIPCFEKAKKMTKSMPVYEIVSIPKGEGEEDMIAMGFPFFTKKDGFKGMLLITIRTGDLIGGFVPEEALRCMQCNIWAVDPSGKVHYEGVKGALHHASSFQGNKISLAPTHAGRSLPDEHSSRIPPGNGTGAVVVKKPLHIGGQTWSVLLSTPEAMVSGLLSDFRTVYLIGTSSALFLIIGSSIFMVLLIYKGNIRLMQEVDERSRAEAQLKEAHDELEYRVEDRTAELNATNRLLEKEIKEKELIENKLREQNTLIRNTLESLSHPFYVIDVSDYSIKMANAASNFHAGPSQNTCYALTHNRSTPCDDKEHPCTIKEILRTGEPVILEHIHFDNNGNEQFIEVHGYPIHNSSGNVEQVIEYNLDITERKQAEDRIKASLLEKEVLLKEIHHRVKNNMQVISSLLDLQSRCIEDGQLLEMFRDSKSRIKAMALIHEQLYQSSDLTSIDFDTYIRSLVNGLIAFYGKNSSNVSFDVTANGIDLGIDTAIPCGLIINELVSNSLKHAFPDGRPGEIRIMLHETTEERDKYFYELVVQDNGIGIPEGLIVKDLKTLGLNVVVTLVEHQMQGSFDMLKENGTKFVIRFNELKYKKGQ